MSTNGPEAGWYPDPHAPGMERYWNGGVWTEHHRPYETHGGSGGLIAAGYLTAFLMPLIGFVLGIVIATRPDKSTSGHGGPIIILSCVVFALVYVAITSPGSY